MSLLPIDTEKNSSFLNSEKLDCLRTAIDECRNAVAQQKTKRQQLKAAQQYLTFDRVFKTRGVQGITGILKVKDKKACGSERVVFKLSVSLDKGVEHENLVSTELNKLRPYCPHFVGNVGMINLPISNDFVNEPEKESLFKNNNDYFPCNVLLIEYVSPISFYHVCKYLHSNKSLIISQFVQIMMALAFAQQDCMLTQYDMHLDNILERQCEETALFLYRHKGRNILVPTYGLYPVIIDLGSSYVKAVEGKPMYTSSDNYNNGLQPTLYDNLNDIHHMIVSSLFYLEDKGYVYDFLRTRFLFMFRHVPMLSHKGWKQLPHDILDIVLKRIKKECPNIKKFDVYKAYSDDIIEILNGLIVLPWKDSTTEKSFDSSLTPLLKEIQKIQRMKSVENGDEILYILRETVDLINEHRESYNLNPQQTIQNFAKSWRERIGFIIHYNMKEIPRDLDFNSIFSNSLKVAELLSSTYYEHVQDHVELINQSYLMTPIKGPLDAVNILLQNATPSFTIGRENKIYIWDSHTKTKQVVSTAGLTDEQLNTLNDAPIKLKGNILLSQLGIN